MQPLLLLLCFSMLHAANGLQEVKVEVSKTLCPSTVIPANCNFNQKLTAGAPTTPNLFSSAGDVTWVSTPGAPSISHPCSRQGVLRVTPNGNTNKIHIYMSLCKPMDWTFNVGDSSSNNGYGGGSPGSTPWCAEIHNIGERMYVYENVAWKVAGPPVAFNYIPDYFTGIYHTTWHLEIDRCNNVKMTTISPVKGTHFEMRDDQMYKFDDLYIGLNRVIQSSFRNGAGLCEVCVAFETVSCSNSYGPGYGYCSCP